MDAPKKYDIDELIALCRVWKKRCHLMLFLARILVVLGKEWSFGTAEVLGQGHPGCMLGRGVVPSSKTVMGALRAFPRLVEPPLEGQPAKKPDWRRLHLDEAKKDAVSVDVTMHVPLVSRVPSTGRCKEAVAVCSSARFEDDGAACGCLVVELLIQRGCNVTLADKEGYAPMDAAAWRGRPEVMEVLLKYSPFPSKLHSFHRDGYAPLHRACWGKRARHSQVVRLLLEARIKPELPSVNGTTCLELATRQETKDIVALHLQQSSSRADEVASEKGMRSEL
ncbi:Ank3 [Symbiodinium sp. CCMP2592]|nr:Ank3 [Symbiodinium sp. CCMP2592]